MKYSSRKSYKTIKKKSPFRLLKYKAFWVGLLVVAIIVSLVYLLLFSSVFKIKSIDISGTDKVFELDILSQNIFLADFSSLDQEILKKHPNLREITIKKKLPNKILIKAFEREAVAILCSPSASSLISGKRNYDCFDIDTNGIIFRANNNLNLPIIKSSNPNFVSLGTQIIAKEYLANILKIIKTIDGLGSYEIYPISDKRLNILIDSQWFIYFNPKENINQQIESMEILLKERLEDKEDLEYIDLRFSKIYIKILD